MIAYCFRVKNNTIKLANKINIIFVHQNNNDVKIFLITKKKRRMTFEFCSLIRIIFLISESKWQKELFNLFCKKNILQRCLLRAWFWRQVPIPDSSNPNFFRADDDPCREGGGSSFGSSSCSEMFITYVSKWLWIFECRIFLTPAVHFFLTNFQFTYYLQQIVKIDNLKKAVELFEDGYIFLIAHGFLNNINGFFTFFVNY